ncbi:zeta toxin family protein [Streptomyces sp. NPDC003710]
MVVVAGQPGAGKTQIADLVQAVLDRCGGAVRVGRDLYKPVQRHYADALAADVRTAAPWMIITLAPTRFTSNGARPAPRPGTSSRG